MKQNSVTLTGFFRQVIIYRYEAVVISKKMCYNYSIYCERRWAGASEDKL